MKKNHSYSPVRFSHLTSYSGVGSIVRGNNDFLMVVTDIRFWTDKNGAQITDPLMLVERVKKHLKTTKELHAPPMSQVNKGLISGDPLPAVIFPSYAKCRSCNRLHNRPWYGVDKEISKDLHCDNCHQPYLEQVTWCVANNNGDLKDVPWHFMCHRNSKKKCEQDYGATYLEIISGPGGEKKIKCSRCGAENSFESSQVQLSGCSQPWIREPDLSMQHGEKLLYTVMEVNDPRVYIESKKRAVVIPPESNIDKNSITYKLLSNSALLSGLQSENRPLKKKKILILAAHYYRCTIDDIKKALIEIEEGHSDLDNFTIGEMYNDEFNALVTEENFNDGADFVTKHKTKVWASYLEGISLSGDLKLVSTCIKDIVAVDRLRVIEVFKGFSRDPEGENKVVLPPDISNELNWIPAIELFGEGVFFSINEEILEKWESIHAVKLRAAEIAERYESYSGREFENLLMVSPRFLLLHTLSHLVIRELEISAGYPSASLKERIYSSQADKMAGVLIYTAVPDIAGSLGGIVEAAEPNNFLKLLDGIFKHAQWCSLDPVCTEHEGQGPSNLNRAACHACALVPETSCEYGNVLLDRVFIKGNKRLNIPAFFSTNGRV